MKELENTTVVVIGQGYVGLPVAITAVDAGFNVVGLDISEDRIAKLQGGISYIGDITNEQVQAALSSGRFHPTTKYGDANGFDFAVITVPTPLRETLPDLTYIQDAARAIGPQITHGATIILESTTYPGTTEEMLVPLLEKHSGLTAGKDFFVGYSPERIDPGNSTFGFTQTPKVVSGIDEASLEKVDHLYSQLIDRTVRVRGTKEAELSKLLENTFRHVNIALVNEIAMFANQLNVDVWAAIDAANTKPFGFMKFTPGPGVGGHCLPVDPSYLSWQVKRQLGQNFRFVELANDVNDHMPNYVVQRIISLLNLKKKKALNGAKVLVIGLAYKGGTGDIRESPALKVIELLADLGAEVTAVDPHVRAEDWPNGIPKVELTEAAVNSSDLVVVLTAHRSLDLSILEDSQAMVFDTQNVVSGKNVEVL